MLGPVIPIYRPQHGKDFKKPLIQVCPSELAEDGRSVIVEWCEKQFGLPLWRSSEAMLEADRDLERYEQEVYGETYRESLDYERWV